MEQTIVVAWLVADSWKWLASSLARGAPILVGQGVEEAYRTDLAPIPWDEVERTRPILNQQGPVRHLYRIRREADALVEVGEALSSKALERARKRRPLRAISKAVGQIMKIMMGSKFFIFPLSLVVLRVICF